MGARDRTRWGKRRKNVKDRLKEVKRLIYAKGYFIIGSHEEVQKSTWS